MTGNKHKQINSAILCMIWEDILLTFLIKNDERNK